jgi:hypothetical protein
LTEKALWDKRKKGDAEWGRMELMAKEVFVIK